MSNSKKSLSKTTEQNSFEVEYHFDESESPEETQRQVDFAFDVLFESIYKNYWLKLKQQEKNETKK